MSDQHHLGTIFNEMGEIKAGMLGLVLQSVTEISGKAVSIPKDVVAGLKSGMNAGDDSGIINSGLSGGKPGLGRTTP